MNLDPCKLSEIMIKIVHFLNLQFEQSSLRKINQVGDFIVIGLHQTNEYEIHHENVGHYQNHLFVQ